jgi:hypothetical protein
MYSAQAIFQHHFQCKKVHTILDKIRYKVFVNTTQDQDYFPAKKYLLVTNDRRLSFGFNLIHRNCLKLKLSNHLSNPNSFQKLRVKNGL